MSRPTVVIACMTWLLRIVGASAAPTSRALMRRWRSRHSIRSGQCNQTIKGIDDVIGRKRASAINDLPANHALAAMISTSTRISGQTSCGMTSNIAAGRAWPR